MKILQRNVQQAEFARTVWVIKPEPGTTLEDLLQPETWAHIAKTLRPGDRIEVMPAGGEWFAELQVRSSANTEARVSLLRRVDFADPPTAASVEIDVKHRGRSGWSVIRKSDKTVLVDGLQTKEEADEWAKLNLG